MEELCCARLVLHIIMLCVAACRPLYCTGEPGNHHCFLMTLIGSGFIGNVKDAVLGLRHSAFIKRQQLERLEDHKLRSRLDSCS